MNLGFFLPHGIFHAAPNQFYPKLLNNKEKSGQFIIELT